MDLGLRVKGLGFKVTEGLGPRVYGFGVKGLGFRVSGLEVRGLGFQGLFLTGMSECLAMLCREEERGGHVRVPLLRCGGGGPGVKGVGFRV